MGSGRFLCSFRLKRRLIAKYMTKKLVKMNARKVLQQKIVRDRRTYLQMNLCSICRREQKNEKMREILVDKAEKWEYNKNTLVVRQV